MDLALLSPGMGPLPGAARPSWVLGVVDAPVVPIQHKLYGGMLCGCVAVWLCGCAAVRLCGCVAMWLGGCVAVWLGGCVDAWLCGSVAV
jgi:hypothetical protein